MRTGYIHDPTCSTKKKCSCRQLVNNPKHCYLVKSVESCNAAGCYSSKTNTQGHEI